MFFKIRNFTKTIYFLTFQKRNEEEKMSTPIKWLESLDEALKEAKEKEKAVFLDFFNPG